MHQRIASSLAHLTEELKLQQGYPFMMHWSDRLSDRPAEFMRLITEFERFFFRYKTICGQSPAKVLKVLVGISRRLESPAGLDQPWLDNYLSGLIEDDANNQTFRRQLGLKLGYGGSATKRTRYALFMLARAQWVGPLVADQLHNSVNDKGPKGEKWTLEHIHPQNPRVGKAQLNEDLIDSLGNLCLLNPQINSALSNLTFKEKCTKALELKNKNRHIYVADSARLFYDGLDDWTSNDVKERSRVVIDDIMQFFAF